MPDRNIVVVVGSLRGGSFTRRVAQAIVRLAPGAFGYQFAEIGQLPLYNQDLDAPEATPKPWIEFRDFIRPFAGVLFATPEHNRSIPAALKNALDVGSRPYGQSAWAGKPAGIVSVTPGAMGGFGANHHLRQSLVFLNMPAMAQPEAYIGHAADLIADDFSVKVESTRTFLSQYMGALETFVSRFA
ncbi:MAG: NAD(P)H-dependent oxidoreductase [Pseudomonadota bacterium]|nr:NAD(P)H-dependent oxidoreductase [Pseudomonadota bacterium]